MSFPILRIEDLNKDDINRILTDLKYYLDINIESKNFRGIRSVNFKNLKTEQELNEISDNSLVLYRGDLCFKTSSGLRKL